MIWCGPLASRMVQREMTRSPSYYSSPAELPSPNISPQITLSIETEVFQRVRQAWAFRNVTQRL